MNFQMITTRYGRCMIGSDNTLSMSRLVKGYLNASRVMLCSKPMLLAYSNDIDLRHCLYDDLYLMEFNPDRVLLNSILFNDVFCIKLLEKDISDLIFTEPTEPREFSLSLQAPTDQAKPLELASSQFTEFASSLHNPSKVADWIEKGLMTVVLPLKSELPDLSLSDNLGLPAPSYLPDKRWSNTCCLDFDGVISKFGVPDAGEPVEGVLSGIERLVNAGWHIDIYSGRSRSPSGIASLRYWLTNNFPSLAKYVVSGVISFAEHKPTAKVYIDDRAILFIGWDSITPENLDLFRAHWQHEDSTE